MCRIIRLLHHLFEKGFNERIVRVHIQQGSQICFSGFDGLNVSVLIHIGNGFQLAAACILNEHYFFGIVL
ncbi:hypothetical protein SDC9_122654 [bioreactor metagenome]|uniref:Uncharacterized protein n=1 Tax=bioreactor metagenome TaxID=1076179 RepID=A0A645CFG1_9ZZZZ